MNARNLSGRALLPALLLAAAAGVLAGCSDGEGSAWDTCEGYRADVAAGSAQDTRDIKNGNNPCY